MEHDLDHPDPMRALGLSAEASEADVRAAYDALVEVYPSDGNPEAFRKLRTVYERALALISKTGADVVSRLKAIELQALMNEASRAAAEDPEMISIREEAPIVDSPEPEFVDELPELPPRRSREAVEGLLREGRLDDAMQELVALRQTWKVRDPERWAFWLMELARPHVFSAPDSIAMRLIGEASTCDLGASWLSERLEAMRRRLELARELIHASRSSLLPEPFIEFLKAAVDAEDDEVLAGVVALDASLGARRWRALRLRRMNLVLPATCAAWDAVKDRAAAIITERIIARSGAQALEREISEFIDDEGALHVREPRWLRPGWEHRIWYVILILVCGGVVFQSFDRGRLGGVTLAFVLAAVAMIVNGGVVEVRYGRFRRRLRERLLDRGLPMPLVLAVMSRRVEPDHRGAYWLPLLNADHGLAIESLAAGAARVSPGR